MEIGLNTKGSQENPFSYVGIRHFRCGLRLPYHALEMPSLGYHDGKNLPSIGFKMENGDVEQYDEALLQKGCGHVSEGSLTRA